jgi:hypothetical protein
MLKSVLTDGGEGTGKDRHHHSRHQSQADEEKHDSKNDSSNQNNKSRVDTVFEGIQKSMNLNSVPKASHKRTNSVLITHFSTNFRARSDKVPTANANAEGRKRMGNNLVLDGKNLGELLREKPELSEFLVMEIQNMKISSDFEL